LRKSSVPIFGIALFLWTLSSTGFAQTADSGWVTAWGTSQQGQGQTAIGNATVRMIARATLPGDSVRIRLDNTFGTTPVTFSHATVAPRVRGAAVAPLIKTLSFAGKNSVTIPAGGSVESDPAAIQVDAQQDLAVSLFVAEGNVRPSQHNNAVVTSYLTDNGSGDQTESTDGKAFTGKTTSMFWLKAIDIRPSSPASTIVAFGDSITDGTCSTLDAHDRWEDILAERLALQNPVRLGVVNEGIGGNTVTDKPTPPNSPPGMERLERDVLSHPGVSSVVVFMGTNDIRRGASADQVIAGLKDIITRVKAKRIRILGATIIPRHSVVPGVSDTGWSDEKTAIRKRVNDWIRKDAGFDAVLDFDRVVRSAENPDLLNPAYNCGDGIHPSLIGYFQMGKAVDLGLFGQR
jgi:lysophospholipase L1-like esterase